MMDWPQVIGIACWCFIFGLIVGERIGKADRHRDDVLEQWWVRSVSEIQKFETFAGGSYRNWATIRDNDGQLWRLEISRETEA